MNIDQIQNLKNQAISNIIEAQSMEDLENIRISYLGRNGSLSQLMKQIPTLEPEKRGEVGRVINDIKYAIENVLSQKKIEFETKPNNNVSELDITAPGIKPPQGHLHLVTQAIEEITNIFERIGFTRRSYPEVEWDWYAFEGLNMPNNHPARDDWETFFIENLSNSKTGQAVLTPHTSSGQLREMLEIKKPPIRMLNIAKCYRRQSDVSHAPMFYQFEGLVVDKGINVTHLKGTLDYFVKQYFGSDRKVRIRPFHFQFTEPSFEVDVTCLICGGKARLPDGQGCKVCKEGWVEIGGSGIVHPTVLKNGNIDPKIYTGFAFGWGVERVMMMKYGIPDIRLLFDGDLRFLNQF